MNSKVVLVTGANGGLGRFVTEAFLDAGAAVVGTARKISDTDFGNPNFTAIPADISDGESAKALVEQVVAKFGRLDVVVHTVGAFGGGSPVAETDAALLQQMLAANLMSVFYVARASIAALRKAGDGRLIAIGSRQAVQPAKGVGAYSASKAAMLSLIKTVAMENEDAGMRANVILPGTMDTPGNRKAMPKADFSKWVQPAAVASLAVWLAGEGGKDVNGAAIPVYGGEV